MKPLFKSFSSILTPMILKPFLRQILAVKWPDMTTTIAMGEESRAEHLLSSITNFIEVTGPKDVPDSVSKG